MRSSHAWALKGLLVISSMVFSAIIIEVFLRIWNPFPFRVKADHVVLPINIEYRIQRQFPNDENRLIVHRKNGLGFRGPDLSSDFDQRLTIFAVGGSTTENFYSNDGTTWPDILAQRLQSHFRGLWLNNAGLDGHSTAGHYMLLQDYILPLHPKVVLLLIGVNDVGNNQAQRVIERRTISSAESGPFGFREFAIWAANNSEFASLLLNLYRVGVARHMGVSHQFGLPHAPPVTDEEAAPELRRHQAEFIPKYEDRIRALIALIRESGAFPILATQPSILAPAPGAAGALEWRILELYNDATRRMAAQGKFPLVDLASDLPPRPEFYYDGYHTTEAGALAIGELIAAKICPILRDGWPAFFTSPCL